MNNEIMEILDYLKNNDYSPVFADEGCDDTPYKLFEECEIKILLDYITNLQNENECLRNELKSKPDNEITLETKDGQIMTIIQSERIDMQEKLNKSLSKAIEKYQDYKSRCEKAIEYIKQLKNYRFEFTFDAVDRHEIVGCEKNFVKDLLNILNGGDKE